MRTLSVLLMTFLGLSLSAQTEVLVKAMYKPGKEYRQVTVSSMDSEMDITGEPEVMERISMSGLALPVLMKASTEFGILISTSEINEVGSLPAILTFDKMRISMQTMGMSQDIANPVERLVIEGWYDKEGLLTVGSAVDMGGNFNKDELAKTLNQFQYMTDFPDYSITVGDSFTRKSPLFVPGTMMSGLSVLMETVYTASEITNGQVVFLMKIGLTMGTATVVSAAAATLTGGGSGRCVYDIASELLTEVTMNLDYVLSMNTQGMHMTVKMTGTTKQTTTIQ
jgi:hypothetical protein